VSAVERWRDQLRALAIPAPILEAAPESPYGFPTELFRQWRKRSDPAASSPTTARAREALPLRGTLLDVGVGAGAMSLPLADVAGAIVGVDASLPMLEAFLAEASVAGVSARAVHGSWPEMASEVEPGDVVVCGHVLYNVQDLAPFTIALGEHARRRVVVEITDRHPWAWMGDLWQRFHHLDRHPGPTADDAIAALRQIGIHPRREEHESVGHAGFERMADAIALVRKRLCLPAERDDELREALGERLSEDHGLWSAGPPVQHLVTLWWDRGPARGRRFRNG
jgi:SAM-dependent methyltransferase